MDNTCSVEYLDHVGIAVHDIRSALSFFEKLFGICSGEIVDLPDQGVRASLLSVGQTRLELLEASFPESSVGRFLEKRGEGLHHIAFNVKNISASLRQLSKEKITLIDQEPREGLSGMIAFLHPKSMHGILTELVQTV